MIPFKLKEKLREMIEGMYNKICWRCETKYYGSFDKLCPKCRKEYGRK